MGLNCKQVISSDGLDWSETLLQGQTLELQPKPPVGWRQQQQNPPETQTETMKCPRCYSTNTKFCYYNNYKKSQPRHFCKTCKRHWTKGGTLRNVPVGGGRKNKRLKTSKTSAKGAANVPSENGNMINRVNQQMVIEAQQQKQNLPLPLGDHQKHKGMSEIMCQALISPPSFSVVQQNFISCSSNNNHDNNNNGAFLRSNLSSLSQNKGLHFPCSTSNSSSISTSFGSANDYNYSTATDQTMEDSIITAIMPTTNSSTMTQPWQLPNTSYWNWDDLDTFVPTDLNIPSWDIDSELSP